MKGLTHFMTGVAAATFFRQAVDMAVNDLSFIIVLGGAFGILPDTLDFKLARFFTRNEYIVDPDPRNPDPQKIADTVTEAMERAWDVKHDIRVQFHTIRLGVDIWRAYIVRLNAQDNQVEVTIGPIVSTSQVPYAGTEPKENNIGISKVRKGQLYQSYDRPSQIDIMSGPQFGFIRNGDRIESIFLPWHRQWSHSFTAGLMFGIIGFIIFWLIYDLKKGLLFGAIITLGFNTHVACDLLGFMGGNLFFPFTKERSSGLKVMKASNPLGNFLMIWGSALIVVFNLNRFSPEPTFVLPWYLFFLYWWLIPALVLVYLTKIFSPKKKKVGETNPVIEGNKEIEYENKEDQPG